MTQEWSTAPMVEPVAKLTAELAECYRLTGAEPAGVDAMDARYAVKEVKRLRSEYDATCDALLAFEDEARKAR
jgi:Tfp pilus assembly protein PilE